MMLWNFCTWTLLLFFTITTGHNTLHQGYTLSPSGYHVCPGTELITMTNVISIQSAYTQMVPCGGWLPWNMCNVTRYSTVYQTQNVTSEKAVMKCCQGYEQVGSYCALALNRSSEFTAKPGGCPVHPISASGPRCLWDSDCPDWQKCCQTENQSMCVEPQSHMNMTWWLNVTVTVKAAYSLMNTSKGMVNHMRLLHSVVTGVLSSPQVSVYHMHSWSSGLFSTSSYMLLGSSQRWSLNNISDSLLLLLENIEEVTAVDVRDVDECSTPMLNECSPLASCTNTPGSYNCTCAAGSADLQPSKPVTQCTSIPNITNLWAKHVTSFSFQLFWDVPSQINLTTNVSLFHGTHQLGVAVTELSNWTWTNLQPGVLYTAQVTLCMCGYCGNANKLKVKTDTRTIKAVARITNINFTDALRNPNSQEYKTLSEQIRNETLLSLPCWILELVHSGKVLVLIANLSEGSVVATFYLVFLPDVTQTILPLASEIMQSLQNSRQFIFDINSTHIMDVNECALGETDCSPWAECKNKFSSYTCECLPGYTDANTEMPGRICTANTTATSTSSPDTRSSSSTSNKTAFTMSPFPTNTATIMSTSVSVNKEMPTSSSSTSSSSSSTSSSSTSSSSTTSSSSSSSTTSSSTRFIPVTYGTNELVSSSTEQSEIKPTKLPTATSSSSSPTPPSNISTIPTTATTVLTSTSQITVECSTGFMVVIVSHQFLEQKRISASSLYLGVPRCNQTNWNNTHVMLSVAWGTCETQMQKNSQNSSVQVTLYSTDARLQVPVICTYINSFIISTGYTSSGYDTINNVVEGSGMYQVTVRLLNGTDPLPQNYTLSPYDEVIIEVGLSTNMTQLKVVINQCWANPSNDPNKTPQKVFLENSCPVPQCYTTVLQNGESTCSLLAVNLFQLVEFNIIYLHCHIQICIETFTGSCRPTCNLATTPTPKLERTSRGANVIGMTKASYGPLLKSHLEETLQATVWNMRTIGFILLALGVCVMVLAAVAVALFCRRRMGKYNFQFKPRKENVTYHVFDT